VASTTLNVGSPSAPIPVTTRMSGRSSRDATTPSETRKPATSSKSSPGVRIVTLNRAPPIRISSGSSSASTSSRVRAASPTRTVRTRRLAIALMRR
jgi:hypothetical protein